MKTNAHANHATKSQHQPSQKQTQSEGGSTRKKIARAIPPECYTFDTLRKALQPPQIKQYRKRGTVAGIAVGMWIKVWSPLSVLFTVSLFRGFCICS